MQPTCHRVPGRLLKLVLATALGVAGCLPAQGIAAASTLQEQTATAVATGLHLDPNSDLAPSLQLLRSPSPLPGGAQLRLISVKALFAEGTWLLRLECESRNDCLPFYALLRPTEFDPDVIRRLQLEDGKKRQHSPVEYGSRFPTAPLERAGDQVEVVEELSGMHLRTRGVCLQSGSLGDRIRVRNLSTHRVLTVTVAGRKLVRVEH